MSASGEQEERQLGRSDELTLELARPVRDILRPTYWPVSSAVLGLAVVVTTPPSGRWPILQVAAAFAAVFLLGYAIVSGTRTWLGGRGRRLLIAPDRIERIGPTGVELGLSWDDVRVVGLRTGRVRRGGAVPWREGPELTVLELVPTRAADRDEPAYRISLGSRKQEAERAREALEAVAGETYAGVRDVGTVDAADLL